MVIRILMEFVMLFCSDRFQYGNPLLFFFFNLFSILPTRFKDPFILKKKSKIKEQRTSAVKRFLWIYELGEKNIYIYKSR